MTNASEGERPFSFANDLVWLVALLATALALGAAMAHGLELPNKIGLPRDSYFLVQKIYAGWNRLGLLLLVEAVAIIAVIVLHRRQRQVAWPATAAFGFLVVAQSIFWLWTFPANQATRNWTAIPDGWEALRLQWEYSHLAGACAQVLVMAFLIVAVLRRART